MRKHDRSDKDYLIDDIENVISRKVAGAFSEPVRECLKMLSKTQLIAIKHDLERMAKENENVNL